MDVIVPDRSQRVMPEAEIEKQENDEAAEGDMESDPARGGQLQAPPPERWQEELTVRGLVAALLIGFIYTVIVMKILLTTGQVPTLNVSAALIAFLSLQGWTRLLDRLGVPCRPFTRQENTVVQTCVVACYTIAFGGGFGSTLLGLNKRTYEQTGDSAGNVPGSWKEPGIGWMTGFLLAVSFGGLLTLIPLRKVLVIDYKLTYPSGTATAVLINGFHTTQGDKNSKKQIHGFLKYFGLSFFWSFFQWFYTGGDVCGFVQFPTLGLKAWKQTFFFDFSATYIGAGMICPHIVNISTLFGAIISWGLMWPLLSKRKGDWYPAIASGLICGDGIWTFPSSLLALAKIKPPICMKFTPRHGDDGSGNLTRWSFLALSVSVGGRRSRACFSSCPRGLDCPQVTDCRWPSAGRPQLMRRAVKQGLNP